MKRGAVATIVGGWARVFVSDLGMASTEVGDVGGVPLGGQGSAVGCGCKIWPPSEFDKGLAVGACVGCCGAVGTGSSMKSPGGKVEYFGTREMFGSQATESVFLVAPVSLT